MKYIIIERVLKEKCPPGVDNFWNFSKIPHELWQIWDKREIDEDITPDIYSDQMDENIEGYSRDYPEYFWNWYVESKKEAHYDILIDGSIYEGSESLETALYLFNTVDNTCLREYYGHTKTLQATDGEQTLTLKEEKIGKPTIKVRISFKDGSQKESEIKLFPEEAASYLMEEHRGAASKIEILNSEGEIVLEY